MGDDVNDDGNGATDEDIDDNGNSVTEDKVNNDGDGVTEDDVDDNGDNATDDNVDDDIGVGVTGNDLDNNSNGRQQRRRQRRGMRARRRATRVTIAIATTAKMPAHLQQLRLCIGDGKNTSSREVAARQEAEAVQRDGTRQPAGANKEEGSRMDTCGGCATKGDARQRHTTTGNVTTSRQTRGK
jgi:hypothetical protein